MEQQDNSGAPKPKQRKSADFYLYSFKIRPCFRSYPHNWSVCPYVHPGEKARRRDPRRLAYRPLPCPHDRTGGECPEGDACTYTHNVYEYHLHPMRFRTQMCQDGEACYRQLCFFAHSPDELRAPDTSGQAVFAEPLPEHQQAGSSSAAVAAQASSLQPVQGSLEQYRAVDGFGLQAGRGSLDQHTAAQASGLQAGRGSLEQYIALQGPGMQAVQGPLMQGSTAEDAGHGDVSRGGSGSFAGHVPQSSMGTVAVGADVFTVLSNFRQRHRALAAAAAAGAGASMLDTAVEGMSASAAAVMAGAPAGIAESAYILADATDSAGHGFDSSSSAYGYASTGLSTGYLMQMQSVSGSSGQLPVLQLDAQQAGLPGTAVGGVLSHRARPGNHLPVQLPLQQQFQQQQQAQWMPVVSTGQGYAVLGGADAEALLALSGGNPAGLPEFSNQHQQPQLQQLQQHLQAQDAAAAMHQAPAWMFEPQNQILFQAAAMPGGGRRSAESMGNLNYMPTGYIPGPPSQGSLAATAAGQVMSGGHSGTILQAAQQQPAAWQQPEARHAGLQRMHPPSAYAAQLLGMQHVPPPSVPLPVPGPQSATAPLFYMPASPASQGLVSATLSSVELGAGGGVSSGTLQGMLHEISMYDVQVQELRAGDRLTRVRQLRIG